MRVGELFDLRGKTALVTGGGRGIGLFLAKGLAEAGARVFVASRKLANCEQAAREIEARGGSAVAIEADVSQPESCDALLARVLAESERLDILVNNAAMVWAAPTLDYPLAAWDRVFDLNVRGLWHLSQQAARHMAGAGGGSLIHVASISAWRGAPDVEQNVVAYNASKGAVCSLTVDMAVKLAPLGIRVNAIAPGPFLTDMMNHIRHDEAKMREYASSIPLGRAGDEDDIKGAVVFLASEAGRFVTGQILAVDGGVLGVYPAGPGRF